MNHEPIKHTSYREEVRKRRVEERLLQQRQVHTLGIVFVFFLYLLFY